MPPILAPRGAPPTFIPPTVVRIPFSTLLHPLRRQQQQTSPTTVPGNYNYGGPEPGTVVGITLGSVAAFLLVLYLFYTCMSIGNPSRGRDFGAESTVGSVLTTQTRRRSHRHGHRSQRSASARRATVIVEEEEVRAAEPRLERIVVEERRRSVSRPAPVPPPPPRVVRESDFGSSDDEVVVIEEHSPSRPRRESRRRESRGESGYRDIEPDRYAGGDLPMREVRRSSRRRSQDRR